MKIELCGEYIVIILGRIAGKATRITSSTIFKISLFFFLMLVKTKKTESYK